MISQKEFKDKVISKAVEATLKIAALRNINIIDKNLLYGMADCYMQGVKDAMGLMIKDLESSMPVQKNEDNKS